MKTPAPGSITIPDGRECVVVFRRSASGPAGRLIITDAAGIVVYNQHGFDQTGAVFDFYNWLSKQGKNGKQAESCTNILKMVYACLKTVEGFGKTRYEDITVADATKCTSNGYDGSFSGQITRVIGIRTTIHGKPATLSLTFFIDPRVGTCWMGQGAYPMSDVLPLAAISTAPKKRKRACSPAFPKLNNIATRPSPRGNSRKSTGSASSSKSRR